MAEKTIGADGGEGKELVASWMECKPFKYRPGERKPYAYWEGESYVAWRLHGLLQAYADAEKQLQFFTPGPEKVVAALRNPDTTEITAFMLDTGGTVLACLRCLEIGNLELLKSYLNTIGHELFRLAEKQEGAV